MLWAVLQFALPAAASTADALVEREARAQVAHVEADSATSCRPVHLAECALCQLLSRDFAPAAHAPLPAIASSVPCGVRTATLAPATAAIGRLPLPRAPPVG
jgi:hypothetical protein